MGDSSSDWSALGEIGAYERHFNELQSKYRALASTWLLATFGAVGFVLSQDSLQLPFDRLAGASALALAGAIGIALLWNLDLMVYHRLLDAVFVAALEVEARNTAIPPIRTNMVRAAEYKGVLPRVVWFYMCGVGVLLLVGSVTLVSLTADEGSGWAAGAAGGCLVVIVGSMYLIHRNTCTDDPMVAAAAEEAIKRQGQVSSELSAFRAPSDSTS